MDKEYFLERMTDILDAENKISFDTNLNDIEEWDSLSLVSYIAMANTDCGRKIEAKKVRNAATVQDLYDMLQ